MIWIAIGLLAVAALAPLAIALERGTTTRGTRDLALSLHRTQLTELDRDLAENRILPAEHATAVLEVQRRLLAAAEKPDQAARIGSRAPILVAAILIPAGALALYLHGGTPDMPSASPTAVSLQQQRLIEQAALIEQLRARLATIDPNTEQGRKGWTLLGSVEESRGNEAAAAQAFRKALSSQFDPVLAVRAAEAATRAEGTLSPASADLLRQALAAAPDAPWHDAVQEMLKSAPPASTPAAKGPG